VNVNAGNDGNVIGAPLGLKNPNMSYTKMVICDVEASCTLRLVDERPTIEFTGGAFVDAVNVSVVFAGSDAAAGSANVPLAPPTAGTATDWADAVTGADVAALAATSCGTVLGATTTGEGAVELPLHAARIAALAIVIAATDTHRPTVTNDFKNTSTKSRRRF